MRAIFFLTLFTAFSSKPCLLAQKIAPPGTIWLRENVYIDLTPVCNIHYREYEYALRDFFKFNLDSLESLANSAPYYGLDFKQILHKSYKAINSDSTILKINRNKDVTWQNWVNYKTYIQLPEYNYYPVVNISYEVASFYCKWRSAAVQLIYASKATDKERSKFHKKVNYRLPTQEEWEYALKIFSENGNIKTLVSKKREPITKVPEKTRLFILTNLSEMVANPMIVKGYNWKQSNYAPTINATLRNSAPSDCITFRCVCEVEDD